MTTSTRVRVVVIGGGIGGVATAAALRKGGFEGELVILDRAEFPYDRPPLSKDYLSGTRDFKQLALQQPEWYENQQIEVLGSVEVESLAAVDDDPVMVTLSDGRQLAADFVVLATGGRAIRPPIPGVDSSRVHVLRNVQDADSLRAVLVPGARLLIVGGGLIGAEVAATARGLQVAVTLVDPLDPPLASAAGTDTAKWLHDQHATHGVETLTTELESLHETSTGIVARLRGGEAEAEFDAVLIGVGIVPNAELAAAAGLDVDRGVLVDDGHVTSHPKILAIGDCSRKRDHGRTEHWEAAQHDGQRAAATILGTDAPFATAPWWWSDRYGAHVEGVGQMGAADTTHEVVIRGTFGVPPFSVFTLRDERVIGAIAVNDPSAARAARRLIDRGINVASDQLSDTAADLRKLLRG